MSTTTKDTCATNDDCLQQNECELDCLCNLLPRTSSPEKDNDVDLYVDEIYQVLGKDILKSSLLDDIDLYLECDEDSLYVVPSKPHSSVSTSQQEIEELSSKQASFKVTFPLPSVPTPRKYYSCDICQVKTSRETLLLDHKYKVHSIQNLFPCSECGYVGHMYKHLQKHVARKHRSPNSVRELCLIQNANKVHDDDIKCNIDNVFSGNIDAKRCDDDCLRKTTVHGVFQEKDKNDDNEVSFPQGYVHDAKADESHVPIRHVFTNFHQVSTENVVIPEQAEKTIRENTSAKHDFSRTVTDIFEDIVYQEQVEEKIIGVKESNSIYEVQRVLQPGASPISGIITNAVKGPVHKFSNSDKDNGDSHAPESNLYKCNQCTHESKSPRALKAHVMCKHNEDRPTYHCDQCPKVFKQLRSLKAHQTLHVGQMVYICEVEHCRKLFASRDRMRYHMLSHVTYRPYICRCCDKAFKCLQDLADHNKTVHSEKHFKCSHIGCSKAYSMPSPLRAHQVSHTVLHQCTWPDCGRSFRDRFNLACHYCTHTGDKPIRCKLCNYSCIQQTSLKWHMEKKHIRNKV